MNTTTSSRTIKRFINQNKITIESDYVDHNPNMDSERDMNHFKVTLRANINGNKRQFTTYFSMGLGLRGEPTAADVLDCIASDSSSIDNAGSFEDWADEFGYDTDSREAERTYTIRQRQARKLRQFLGSEAYELLLWNTERL